MGGTQSADMNSPAPPASPPSARSARGVRRIRPVQRVARGRRPRGAPLSCLQSAADPAACRASWSARAAYRGPMIEAVELRRVALPLVTPFRTSYGTETFRDALLVRVVTDAAEGWGECVARAEPLYSAEFVDAAALVVRDHLLP